ncbi:aldolase/citrate lyase family protein [Lapillicoccus sp.]|uniref:aldolase/citrate lyase family protein n=1 Tax=Lapillicoccus sp. TaxID=1909287 RepID=UPI003263713E
MVTPPRVDPLDLAARVRRGDRLLGGLVRMPAEMLVELTGLVGLDYLVLDAEHGPGDQVAMAHHISTAEAVGLPVIVRIGGLHEVLRVLDLGAAGIIYPHIDSVDEAKALVEAVHYPPRGRRGFAAYTRAGSYGLRTGAEHLHRYADGPLVIAMIESEAAVTAAADIAAVDGIDLLFLGPADLAADLGVLAGDQTPVALALAQVREAAGGRVLSICGDETTARAHFDAGSQVVVYNLQHAVSATFVRLATAAPNTIHAESGAPADLQHVLFLSGMLGDRSTWQDVAADLADVAQPSFPRIDGHDTVEAMAAALLAQAPAHFAVAGHSLGGIVALEMARQAPERVTRLALVNTSARDASPEQLQSWAELTARTRSGEFVDVAAQLGRDTLPEGGRDANLVARNTAMATTVGPEGFLRQLAAQAVRPDSRPALSAITVPTVVISGTLDEVCPPALQEELAAGILDARHVVVTAGHMAPLEAPREVASALRDWLGL